MKTITEKQPFFMFTPDVPGADNIMIKSVEGEDPCVTMRRWEEHIRNGRIGEASEMEYRPTTKLGEISFTVHELCRAVDLRATPCTPSQQMDLLSTALRMCMVACVHKRDQETAEKLLGLRKSVEKSWTSKRDMDSAIADLFDALAK